MSDDLAKSLLSAQCPEYAEHELGRVFHHHEHTAIRLGERYGLMMPNFAWQAEMFVRAPALLARAAPRWKFPVSVPVFLGKPSDDFPYPWHVVTWHESATCANVPLHDAGGDAMIAALATVHAPAPASAPRGMHSGVSLADLLPEWERLLDDVATRTGPDGEQIDGDALDAKFRAAAAQPIDGAAVWTHGNLSPLAVLSDRGAFAGICDWTAFAAGDGAADLGAASLLMGLPTLERLEQSYGGMSAGLLERSRGYRLLYMLRFIATDNPFFTRRGWQRVADVDVPVHAAKRRGR